MDDEVSEERAAKLLQAQVVRLVLALEAEWDRS